MKTNLVCAVLGAMMLLAACRKDAPLMPASNDDSPRLPATERCGCLPSFRFEVHEITSTTAEIIWNVMPEATAYQIEITLDDFQSPDIVPTESSFVVITTDNHISLTGLVPNSTYRYRVTTICRNVISAHSELHQFDTKSPIIRQLRLSDQEFTNLY